MDPSAWYRVRLSDIWQEIGVELLLLHVKNSQFRWFGHLDAFHWKFSGYIQLAGELGVPEHAETYFSFGLGMPQDPRGGAGDTDIWSTLLNLLPY